MFDFGGFWKSEACGQTVLPDRSILIGQKLVENAKIQNFKCDILSDFQTMCYCVLWSWGVPEKLFALIVGSTVDARTHAGLTALHLASECGHTSVVCALLDHHRGLPSIYNSKASIDTLESASSNDKSLDVNSWTTVEHFTALHVAAHSGHTDLIEMLLSKYRVRGH